jgi:glycosyltransferase involved in cell wall biosynthesis
MKKVVCVHLLNNYSGSPLVMKQVIDVLMKNGREVDLYCSNTAGFLSETKANRYSINYKKSKTKIGTLLGFLLSQLVLFNKLLKYRNQDVTFYINTIMPFGASIIGKFMGKRIIYHIHETSVSPLILKHFLICSIKLTSNHNIFVSKDLFSRERIDNIKSTIIYNSLSTYFSKQTIELKNKRDIGFNVLMVCSYKTYKGIYEFLKIAWETKDYDSINYILILDATKSEVDEFIKENKIPLNMIILPSQKDVSVFYKKSSLLLNLSRVNKWVETFGMTILEAMSFGIPVIVPPIGGPTEIVNDGVDGYCISSYEIENIAKKIIELFKDDELYKKLSQNAFTRSKDFSSINFEAEILKIVNDDDL